MAFLRCVVGCGSVEWMTQWTPWYNRDTYTAFPHCVPLNACLSSRTVKTACHTDCIDEVCVFHGHARYVCEDGHAFRRSGCIGGMGTSGHLGRHIVCTWGACHGNICRRKLYHNGHKQSCLHLMENEIEISSQSTRLSLIKRGLDSHRNIIAMKSSVGKL